MGWLTKIKHDAISSRILDEKIYAQVLNEIENGQRRDGLWAKALAHSDGANEKAKSLYIKYRAESIRDEIEIASSTKEPQEPSKQTTEKESAPTPEKWNADSEPWEKSNNWILIVALTFGVFLLSFILGQ